MIAAEEFARFSTSKRFDIVNIVTTGVEAVVRKSFGVFVGEQVAHRRLSREREFSLAINFKCVRWSASSCTMLAATAGLTSAGFRQ